MLLLRADKFRASPKCSQQNSCRSNSQRTRWKKRLSRKRNIRLATAERSRRYCARSSRFKYPLAKLENTTSFQMNAEAPSELAAAPSASSK